MLAAGILVTAMSATAVAAADATPVTAAPGVGKPGLFPPGRRKKFDPNAPTSTQAMAGPEAGKDATPASVTPDDDAANRDLVILDNKQTIAGTIIDSDSPSAGGNGSPAAPALNSLPGAGDANYIMVNTGSGIFRVRKERVVTIVLGLQSRLKDLSSSDLATLIALARWCMARNHDAEALQALTRAVAMPGCDIEAKGLYATLIDHAPDGGPAQALPLYRAYRDGGGTDMHILARLDELEKAMADYQAQLKDLPPGFAPTDDQALALAAKPATPLDAAAAALAAIAPGLETKTWDAENPSYSNPVTVKTDTIGGPDGAKVLDISAAAGDKGKGAARLANLNFAVSDDNAVLSLHVHNLGDQPVKLAIAVKTGNYDYYESVQQTIPPGADFTEMRFNLKASTFKSSATKWANNGTVDNLGQLKEVQILIYNDKTPQEIQVRGLNFIKNSEL